ncbi:MAG: transcription-repair coupling factor [Acidobacteriota bacterium]|nr:transcription-repair coupling factor [Acidobacteriota bacterium]MDH3521995.1 transcription-repair coupling factor [Acidobacteriota bacterium]
MKREFLGALEERLRGSAEYRRLAESGRAVGLPPAAAAWVCGLRAADLGRPVLAVVPREGDALAWVEAASWLGVEASYFPPQGLTPYQDVEVAASIRSREIAALDAWRRHRRVLVATPRALFRRLPTVDGLESGVLELVAGRELPMARAAAHLARYGYERVDLVSDVGQYAVRGGVLDVFGAGADEPLRLDYFGDTLDSLRHFNLEDQRSGEEVERARLLPMSFFPRDGAARERLAAVLRERHGLRADDPAVEGLRGGAGFPGWESHLCASEESVGLAEWLPDSWLVACEPSVLDVEIAAYGRQLESDFKRWAQGGRWALPPASLAVEPEAARAALARAALAIETLATGPGAVDFRFRSTEVFHGQLARFPHEVAAIGARGERLALVAGDGQEGRLRRWCEEREIEIDGTRIVLLGGDLERGFERPGEFAIFSDRQLFPRRAPRPKSHFGPFLAGLRDLRVGDYVVHRDHGIGQFVALRGVAGEGDGPVAGLPPELAAIAGETPAAGIEVMEIAYGGGQQLLLPLSRVDLIERYSGIESVAPRLDRLGGSSWRRRQDRVRGSVRRLAVDLLELYAERRLARAPAMPPATDLYAQFEAAFPYEETPDQSSAVRSLFEDMGGERPMDRLLCGDVGFGKTEVAMRAAFRAVEGGYQVAVLAPTTILADQHLETFRARFAGFPVTVEMVSRFRSPQEIREIARRLAAGEVDILIGTHRLLSRDIALPALGLLIVDEEQRFGVAQKEKLRELKKNVHVLAMSATPVPRTLQLSLAGVRDLSVIETPPRDRMAVETAVLPLDDETVLEAIDFELERGGQVYFVYNRVEGIEEIAEWLRALKPDLRLTIGHGQLPENELMERMHAFKRGEHDVLLATTIIENGIDISNVNTMLIHRADRFGLSQLYQLRGRVGRGDRLAYCYLLVASDRSPSEEARKRLAAIREFSELGAGFRVAARDLEIRGAGNLLGAEQSGHIAAVGLETYLRLLEETVRALQGEETAAPPSAIIDLPVTMTIPETYVADANLRMEIYRRVARAPDREEILAELRDRFGEPPESVRTLVDVAQLKALAESVGVQSVAARGGRLQFRLRRDSRIDLDRLVRWIGERQDVTFSPSGVLGLRLAAGRPVLAAAAETLREIVGDA